EVVRQPGRRVGTRVAVELGPAGVMIEHYAEHQVVRLRGLKLIVPKGACELMRQRRVLVHHDRQTRLTGGRRLNDHAHALANRALTALPPTGSRAACCAWNVI